MPPLSQSIAAAPQAKDPASLQRFTESEVIHCRWAMLGVAGALAVELLGFGNWYDAPLWVSGGQWLQFISPWILVWGLCVVWVTALDV